MANAITFNAVNSGAQLLISNTGGTAAAALSITGNTFQNVNYATAGTGSVTFISNTAATLSQAIIGNAFNNLNVNTAGGVTFIANSVVVPSSGTQNVNNNVIGGSFTKAAGGTVTLFTSSASSVSGSVINNNNNNFSNIIVTGATIIAGWTNTDAGSSTKTIQGNTFTNWTGGTGAITAMSVNVTSTSNATTGNAINNITCACALTGIATAAGNDNIYSNTINGLSTTGAASVVGISATSGTTKNIYRNKIYDLSTNNSGGTVYGISVSGSTSAVITANIYNNIIGDLRATTAGAADPVRGMSLTSTRANSTLNVYYNTIYLNATSSGINFGTTGIYHTVSATATTATLNLRNNIIANYSTPNGTGITVALRNSGTSFLNYASTSNNNLFFAGTPSATRLLFYNGTNADQVLSTYKARITPIDANTVTEDLSVNFLSTSGSSTNFLHLDPTVATQAESGGANISGYSIDYDNITRQGNIGYTGSGTSTDIGADEFEGIRAVPFSGSYTVGTGGNYPSLTRTGGLFADINALGLSGDVTINIISDLSEDGTYSLDAWQETGVGNYTLTFQPNNTTSRTISGNVAGPLIKLNGCDRVTIDGRYNGAGSYLTFRNTNTGGTGTALTFINGASSNTIQYCGIEAYTTGTYGTVLFSTTSAANGGNSSNTISNCNINATVSGNNGAVGIYSSGTVGYENSSNIIANNNIYNFRDKGIDVTATGTTGWTISGNSLYNGDVTNITSYAAATTLYGIRILGGAGYTIQNNYIGGSSAQNGGTMASNTSTAGLLSYWGILLTTSAASPASYIKGNTIGNLAINSVPTATGGTPGNNVFFGIETNGSGISIGGTLAGEGNTVGSNTVNGSIQVTTTTSTATYKSNVRGINCASTGGVIAGNVIGGIDIKNIGAAAGATTFSGIYASNAAPPSQINSNIIGSNGAGAVTNSIRVLPTSTCTASLMYGINLASTVTGTVQLDANIVQNISHLSSANTTGNLIGIISAATGTAAISITNCNISNNAVATYTTGLVYGIYNSGAATSFAATGNTLAGWSSSGTTTGVYSAIFNAGAVTGAITISNNSIGTASNPIFTFSAANSGASVLLSNTAGGATCALTISNNTFQNLIYSTASTGNNTYISNSAATLSQAINGNSFANMNVNTSGNITFISNSVVVSAAGTQNVNNNAISGTFTKRAGGTVTLFTSTATSVAGGVVNNNSNNFSNITVTGATTIAGWVNTDAGAASKTIQNNTFNNWSGGTSALTAMSVNLTSSSNAVSGNTISNISSGGAVTGITTAAGNDNIFGNTINSLSTSASAAVTGIAITAGTTKNIYQNKIYDLQSAGATGSVNGILTSGSTLVTANIYNNIIGDLKVPNGSSATDLIRAIAITHTTASSAANVYYNTVYLNASSTGTTFSTTAIYHTASATATTATLTLRNNSITNTSTPKGTGNSVVLRRSSTATANLATSSNNNLYYAGTPGTSRLLLYDGTNASQTIAAYKTLVSPRDTNSVTEDLSAKYLSTTGSSSVYLHMSTAISSLVESGAINISGITTDFDGQTRQGNSGYSGNGYAPDIGADEVFGIEAIPPVITYTNLSNTTATTNRSFAGVTITDASGISSTSGTKPRVYYKRYRDANTYADNTSNTNGWKYVEASNAASPYSFTIDYSLLYGGSSVTVGQIQYFVVAQDLATIANVGINSGTFNAAPAGVALTSAAFPITGTINSYDIPYSGTYNVGATEVFTSLTRSDGLFGSINRVGLSGNTVIRITSDLSEDGNTALNQWTETNGSGFKLTIQPDAPTTRIVSGNVLGGMIRLDGVDRLIIDGSYSGSGQYLTFRNTNTAGTIGTAITFLNGATTDTIRYTNMEAFADATDGVVMFGASTVGGNSYNVIDNCNINATVSSNTGSVGIYSAGTAGGYENVSNIISNSNIYNYRDRGIDITATGSSAWTISGNSLYNGNVTGSINYAAASSLYGIAIGGGSGYAVVNNYLGGSSSQASGINATYSSSTGNVSYEGIYLNTSSASPASTIKGNRIGKITLSSVPLASNTFCFAGIDARNAGITIGGTAAGEGNIIGSNSINGSIAITTTTSATTNTSLIYGIYCTSTGGAILANQVGGLDVANIGAAPAAATIQGIYINSATAPTPVKNNIVGSSGTGAASNSIRVRSFSTALTPAIYGIALGNSVASTVLLDSNTVQNVSQNSITSSGSLTAINNVASNSAVVTITHSTIRNLFGVANTSASSTLFTGITASSPSTISANIIDNILLPATGTAAQIRAISISGTGSFSVTGNTISNLSTASTKTADVEAGLPSTFNIAGILNSATGASVVVSGNNLYNFSATSTAATNTALCGIGIENGTGNIFNNRISSCTNTATGSALLPGMSGLAIAGGSFNIYNNVVRLDNSFNANGLKIYGINHNAASNSNYYYNTVSVAGYAVGTAARSAAFVRLSTGTLALRNNVLINTRNGTGNHYGICNIAATPAINWTASTSDYNDIYSTNAAKTAEWGSGLSQTWIQFVTSAGGNTHSVNRLSTFLSSTYDLEPNGITNCGLDNSATVISSPIAITADINNVARHATTPDMGAYEFSYSAFAVVATNNSPVCSGDNVSLTADPGIAMNPTYSWTNPSGVVVSTGQNPSILAASGRLKITVTDEDGCTGMDSTLVTARPRPTANLSGQTTICDGNAVSITITVSGTGTVSGTLSNGDAFSGAAPTIIINPTPPSTTSYYVTSLSDANCTSIFPTDAPDTLTVLVRQAGLWSGAVSTAWSVPGNWLCGTVPDSTVDVVLPTGAARYPVVSSGTVTVSDLTIQSGGGITINGASLKIKGDLTGAGAITATSGTMEMAGSTAQNIPAGIIAAKTLKNLVVNNTAGVLLADTLKVSGTVLAAQGNLGSAGKLVLLSSASGTALIDGNGAGQVTGSVTIQRYLPSGFGYRYLSSPFQSATVSEFANEIDLSASFSNIYRYDENLASAGWVSYSTPSNVLNPVAGYAVNCGSSSSTKTVDIRGVVNNGSVSSGPLYNHNQPYTLGFNLVGNPYPSPIDWNAASGWTKTNIDNALYYFNPGSTDQYTGTYTTYINGVSSDGVASNVIPSMQAFFVHVSNGSYPVAGILSLTNAVRTTNLTPAFHKQTGSAHSLIRLAAAYESEANHIDYASIYLDDNGTKNYRNGTDALKLMNTDERVPNLYVRSIDDRKLAIHGLPLPADGDNIPLGIATSKDGWVTISAPVIDYMPAGVHTYLADAKENSIVELAVDKPYRAYLNKGSVDDRFYIVFGTTNIPGIPGVLESLRAYSSEGKLYVYTSEENSSIRVLNAIGQTIKTESFSGKGQHEIYLGTSPGVYVVLLTSKAGTVTGKVYVGSE